MKRSIIFLMILSMLISFVACSGNGKGLSAVITPTPVPEKVALTPTPPGQSDPATEIAEHYDDNLCAADEELLVSIPIADSEKKLSVCIGADYIVYRFGTGDKIELEYPADKTSSWNDFTYTYYLRGGGKENQGMDSNHLIFENNGYHYSIYQVYTAEDDSTEAGIIVTDLTSKKETDIRGNAGEMTGSLVSLRDNEKIKVQSE